MPSTVPRRWWNDPPSAAATCRRPGLKLGWIVAHPDVVAAGAPFPVPDPEYVFVTDVMVQHPATGEEIPLVVADYVLPEFGTGVVMGVPAHDERDFSFAQRLGLPVRRVVAPERAADPEAPWTGDGTLIDSAEFTGQRASDAREGIAELLAELGRGGPVTRYRLQDWLVSRQRYWGSPIPIIYCEQCGMVPVPEEDLPVSCR